MPSCDSFFILLLLFVVWNWRDSICLSSRFRRQNSPTRERGCCNSLYYYGQLRLLRTAWILSCSTRVFFFLLSLHLEFKLFIVKIMTEDKYSVPPCALHTAHYVRVRNGSSAEIILIFFKCIKANRWERWPYLLCFTNGWVSVIQEGRANSNSELCSLKKPGCNDGCIIKF